MKWEVTGADRTTGIERTMILDADNEESARRRGNRAGLMVSDLRPIDAEDSVVGVPAIATRSTTATRLAPPIIMSAPQPEVHTYINNPTNINTGPLKNGWGIAAAIVGTIALVASFVPCLGLIATIPLALAGVILALVGIIVGHSYGRPVLTSYLGGGMCIFAVIIAVAIASIVAASMNSAAQQMAQEIEKENIRQQNARAARSLFTPVPAVPDKSAPGKSPLQNVVSKASYDRISNGMSYSRVKQIIGFAGEEMARNQMDGLPGATSSVETVMYA